MSIKKTLNSNKTLLRHKISCLFERLEHSVCERTCTQYAKTADYKVHIGINVTTYIMNILQKVTSVLATKQLINNATAALHTSAACCRVQSGRYRVTTKRDRPLTYEMANPPHYIAHRKSWNSWNTSTLLDGIRPAQTAVEDLFLRKFMTGTWHSLVCSEIIIKRQANMIRIAAIIRRGISARKMYFLIGYTEELLSYWLQCPVTLELQTVADKKDVVFKYI